MGVLLTGPRTFAGGCAEPEFGTPRAFGEGSLAAVADFNSDGKLDLVTLDSGDIAPGPVSVLLGNGDGTFQRPLRCAPGNAPSSATVADLNLDGRPDLAVAYPFHERGGKFLVLLGRGDGTFETPAEYPQVGEHAYSIASGDVNRDGKPDLVVPIGAGVYGRVAVYLGKGNGSFDELPSWTTDQGPGWARLADLNADGNPDLIILHGGGSVVSYLGKGDGTFEFKHRAGFSPAPTDLTVGDFNRDGVLDYAVAYPGAQGVIVLLGMGDGSFVRGVKTPPVLAPTHLTAVDLDRDGALDLALAAGDGLSILPGKGDGTFKAPVRYSTGGGLGSIFSGNLNGDSLPDLAATSGSSVNVLLARAPGVFPTAPHTVTDGPPTGAAAADFNQDGKRDLALASGKLSLLLGRGDGTFQTNLIYSPAWTGAVRVGAADFNRDGRDDLVIGEDRVWQECDGDLCEPRRTGLTVLLSKGNGEFQAPLHVGAGLTNVSSFAAGDITGDGVADLAVVQGYSVVLLRGRGDGTCVFNSFYGAGTNLLGVQITDVNADGKGDVLLTSKGPEVLVLLGRSDGTVAKAGAWPVGPYPTDISAADLNGDGKRDLVVASTGYANGVFYPASVSVLLGNGDGTFLPARGFIGLGAIPGDYNGDGIIDIAGVNGPAVTVRLGNGDGSFQEPLKYDAVTSPRWLLADDFNGDRVSDLAVMSAGVGMLLSVCQNGVELAITRAEGGVSVSWPASPRGFVLESARGLASLPPSWQAVSGSIVTNGQRFQVALPVGSGEQYFRLRAP
jgi:hypothetical protein